MKLSGLLQRTRLDLPGLAGTARVDRRTDALVRRVKRGEIAVLDQVDLDRATADALVAAGVVAVVNASPSISGRFPNLGPEILIDAGVALVDAVGPEALHTIKDGSRIRLHEGVVYAGELELARGVEQDVESVADALVEAKAGLTHQLEAFAANTTEFMRQERALLLDGVGIPAVDVELAGRQVVVVAAGFDHAAELARLKSFIREYRPVLVGVGAGADALRAAGLPPALIVGDPSEISNETLTCGADIVVPAFNDGHAPGLHRVQDLGASAVTFPSMANPEDLALLLVGPPRRVDDRHSGAVGHDDRVPRPRSFRQQRLDVPHPAAGRRRDRGQQGDRRAVPEPGLGGRGHAADHRRADRGRHGAVRVHGGRRGARLALPGVAKRVRDDQRLVRVISLRYHAVSMAAVFLALAVGVVLGAAGVSDRLLGAVATKADGLTGQVQQLTAAA